jgi:hypothetical protein
MPKRVSLKGKGADIFFGDYTADSNPATSLARPEAEPTDATSQTLPAGVPRAQRPDRRVRSAPMANKPADEPTPPSTTQPPDRVAAKSPSRLTGQSTIQSASRPAGRPVDRAVDKVVDRPKSFYITERIDERLDEAVRYFQMHHRIRKVDRSTVLTTMLSEDGLWTEDALDQLVDRLMRQLTSRLTR